MDDILKFMRSRRIGVGLCEGCIAKGIAVTPVQHVNMELRHLINLGKVRTLRAQCHICGRKQDCFVLRV